MQYAIKNKVLQNIIYSAIIKNTQNNVIKVFKMSKNILSEADLLEYEKLKSQKQKQLDRQNNYNKNNYDRCGVVLKKGEKEKIKAHYTARGFSSFNEYILYLIYNDIGEKPAGG